MKNIYEVLEEELKKQEVYLDSSGEVLKSKVQTAALTFDTNLLELLMNNEKLKETFFIEVNDSLVFDKVKFSWIINNNEFLPNSYTSFQNKIGLIKENNEFISRSNDVVLSYPYKDCILEFDSTDENEKREEIFLNEILAKNQIDTLLLPKVFTKSKLYSKEGNILTTDVDSDNFIIKGNNLLSMHSLLPKYKNSIKAMYWDILYNTNSDIVPYNDSFKHSSWLTMMENRLRVAHELLSHKGSIAIQIDENEMAYLKVLMDEIFGRENKLSTITVKVKAPAGVGQESFLFDVNEYILVYAKDITKVEVNVIPEESRLQENTFQQYRVLFKEKGSRELVKTLNTSGVGELKMYAHKDYKFESIPIEDRNEGFYKNNYENIIRTTNPQGGLMKVIIPEIPSEELYSVDFIPTKGRHANELTTIYFNNKSLILNLSDTSIVKGNQIYRLTKMTNLWDGNFFQGIAREGGVTLKAGKKPEAIMKRIIELLTNEGDTILDAYFGTGTTGAVAMKLGRKFIGLEQLDSHFDTAVVRLKNVIEGDESGISKEVNWNGGGSFITCELLELNQEKISEILKSTDDELGNIYDELIISPYFLNYKVDLDIMSDINSKAEFMELNTEDKKKILISILDKNNLYVSYSEISDDNFKITDAEKVFNKVFYGDHNE